MPQTTITNLEQRLEIKDVTSVVYTEPEQDTDGDWVREFRFFGTPPEGVTGSYLVLVVRAKSPVKDDLRMTTVPLQI